jgi:succinyl-diaminopimelate desuccinylase
VAESNPTLDLARDLIGRRSVTPADEGCQQVLADRLANAGFDTEHLRFGDVDNLWARRGTDEPLLVFAGHTDVVPAGPSGDWQSDPFTPTLRDGNLYGRGAADMKSSLAAFVTAIEEFIAARPEHNGSIGVLITSDEEADAVNGTVKVIEVLQNRGITIDYCVVGEPSSSSLLGDTIKIGRRGSLGGRLIVPGIQGHVAYPELADNPVPRSARMLKALTAVEWDIGNEHFPPTSLQVSNVHAGTGAPNVIPGEVIIDFSIRYSSETDEQEIRSRVSGALDKLKIKYSVTWQAYGNPFLTGDGDLLDAGIAAIHEVTGLSAELSTSGGTSDGRFIAPAGAQVIEIGPVNSTIHKVNEYVDVDSLQPLSAIYCRILDKLLGN